MIAVRGAIRGGEHPRAEGEDQKRELAASGEGAHERPQRTGKTEKGERERARRRVGPSQPRWTTGEK